MRVISRHSGIFAYGRVMSVYFHVTRCASRARTEKAASLEIHDNLLKVSLAFVARIYTRADCLCRRRLHGGGPLGPPILDTHFCCSPSGLKSEVLRGTTALHKRHSRVIPSTAISQPRIHYRRCKQMTVPARTCQAIASRTYLITRMRVQVLLGVPSPRPNA